jgi:hypothetical protein
MQLRWGSLANRAPGYAWLRLGLAVVLLGACSPGAVTDSSGPGPGGPDTTGTGGGGGTIQRGALAVQVQVEPSDAAVVSAAGVSLSGLTVRIQRRFSAEPVRSGVTDAQGLARFEGLLEGSYTVSVERALTATEQGRLPADARDVSVLAGGATVPVPAPGTTSAAVALVASRRGSLVISEFYRRSLLVDVIGNNSHYIELRNVSDTTIYLDGMHYFVTGQGLHWGPLLAECDLPRQRELRLEERGLWAVQIWRFPGSGRNFPVPPGGMRLLATDAIDHRPMGDGGLDLRAADFEFIGTDADPNNPQAADMLWVTNRTTSPSGYNIISGTIQGVALPIGADTLAFERTVAANGIARYFLIPRERIVDVVAQRSAPEEEAASSAYATGLRRCTPFTHPRFDRDPVALLTQYSPFAARRRQLGTDGAGRPILMRTGTSSRDFELGAPLERVRR